MQVLSLQRKLLFSRFDSKGRGVKSKVLYFHRDNPDKFWFCFILFYVNID